MSKRMSVRALVVIVEASEEASEDARRGLEVRAQAMLTGRCACGAQLQPPGCLEHEPECPAISEAVFAAAAAGQVRDVVVPVVLSVAA